MAEWPDYPENPSAEDLKSREDWREARARELDEKVAKLRADHTPRTDIQTALTVLGRRDAVQIAVERNATRPEDRQGIRPENRQGYRLDLCAACLQAADLSHHDLERADLSGARLEGANLCEARLERADLRVARLDWKNIRGARLEGANLR
ncbi:MAG: pentapeptide repeat-containing protein, partial [Rhodobacteraceae bacterium]|nr:pentapeptide repeat-containing protein [Paracoccaceae bacterium]